MNSKIARRAVLLGAVAGAALATQANSQIYVSKAFKMGRPVSINDAAELQARTDLLQGDDRAPIPAGSVVHIPAFRVEVVKRLQKTAKAGSLGGMTKASQQSTFVFESVDDAALQEMTEQLYIKFVADLKARGIRVATLEETRADPDLAVFFGGQASPFNGPSFDGQSAFYAPSGMTISALPGDQRFGGGGGAGSTFSAFSTIGPVMALATGAGKAAQRGLTVMFPRYVLTFVDISSNEDGFLGRVGSTASVSARAGMRVLPESTRLEIYAPTSGSARYFNGWVALSSPVLLGGVDISGLRDATTASQKRGEAAVAVVGALFALGGVSGGATAGYNTSAVRAGPRMAETTEPYVAALQSAIVRRLSVVGG